MLRFSTLGTGHGYSVLDLVKTFEAENKVAIPYRIQGRRAGDIATCYASPEKAKEVLGWEAKKTLKEWLEILGVGKRLTQMVMKTK